MFNKKDFNENFLKFDDNFEINLENQIILGSNGIGKSSIYRTIAIKHPGFDFIDYDQLKKDFIKNKNKLLIGAKVAELESKNNEKRGMIDKLDITNNFKALDVKGKIAAKDIISELKDAFIDHEKAIKNFKIDKVLLINTLPDNDKKFLIKYYVRMSEINNLDDEVKHLKDEYMKSIYEKLDKILEDDNYTCPVCGSVNESSIKNIIKEKKNKLTQVKNDLLILYQTQNRDYTPENLFENFKKLLNTINNENLCKEDIISYYVCGGDNEIAKNIEMTKPKINQCDIQIDLLEQDKESYYKILKNRELEIREIFSNKFGVESQKIVFDDSKKVIEITLPRVVEKYSTGEINLMVFTFNLYQFIASDKNVIVVDDPLSSYDISNQYKIMFDLVNATTEGKKVIILSHNIDCINIANSQHRGTFAYKYIEKYNSTLYLENIKLNESDSVLNINSLLKSITIDNNDKMYFQLLIDRENDNSNKCNLIFHYDEEFCFSYKGATLTNEYFVGLIDNFEGNLSNGTFEINAINKILYLIGIRVWIEKRFYLNSPSDLNLRNKTFGNKLNYIFPKNGNSKWLGSSKVTKAYLMSKKVMINQNCHYKSQILPFNYALNVSIDDLKNEISDIVSHFDESIMN